MQHLTKLLDSMNRPEKAYFSKLHKEDRHRSFYQIYLTLLKTPSIKVADLRKRFPEIPQLSYELNNLYNRLLRSLVMLRLSSTEPLKKLESLIVKSQVLLEKRNLKEGRKLLRKARRLAERYEKFESILAIVRIESAYLFAPISADQMSVQEFARRERAKCLVELERQYELERIIQEVTDLQYTHGIPLAPDEVPDSVRHHYLLDQKVETDSLRSQLGINFARGIRGVLMGDFPNSIRSLGHAADIMRDNRHLRNNIAELTTINNILLGCSLTGDFAAARVWLKRLQAVPCDNKMEKMQARYFDLTIRAGLMLRHQQFQEYDALTGAMRHFLKTEKDKLSLTSTQNLYYQLIYAALLRKHYDHAHQLLIDWQKNYESGYAKIQARQLAVCIHLGLGNYSLVKSELTAYLRLSKDMGALDPVTVHFSRLVGSLSKKQGKVKNREAVMTAYEKFKELSLDPRYRKYFVYFNAIHWLEQCHEDKLAPSAMGAL